MAQQPPPPGFTPGPPMPHQPGPFVGGVPPTGPPAVPPPVPKTGRRIAGRAIDVAALTLVLLLVGSLTVDAITDRAANVLPGEVIGAITDVLFSAGDVEAAVDEVGNTAWNMIVSQVQGAIFILIGFHFVYEAAANLWSGRTLGRMLLDLRIAGPGGSKAGLGRALARAAVTVVCTGGLYGLAWIALLHGSFIGGFALWLLAVAALIGYAAPALFGSARRSLGDLLAGTRVVPAGVYAKAGQVVLQAAQSGSAAARSAAEAARRGAGQVGEQIPMQRMKETGGRWVSGAAESDQAKRLRQLGSSAKERAKGAYQNRRDGGRPPSGPQ